MTGSSVPTGGQAPGGPLSGATVVLGVSGGIAAYKAVEVCRRLVDAGARVAPVLTAGALRFVGVTTFSALASEPARTSLFEGPEPLPHTSLGRRADLVLVAPATAHLIGRYASGISDDLLTATLLATRAPVLLAPAMHTEMWEHPAVVDNVARLAARGVRFVGPAMGHLAGGDLGEGRLAEPVDIVEAAGSILGGASLTRSAGSLAGRRVIVTAGGTREPLDPVRFLGNRSSGKMGYAIAEVAAARGASVVLVSTVSRTVPPGVELVSVETADEMAGAVLSRLDLSQVVVMAAAVADFRPKEPLGEKHKRALGPPEFLLEPTVDILGALVRARQGQFLVGFAAETGQLHQRTSAKMAAKGVDLMVGNDVSAAGSGFGSDTNRALLVYPGGAVEELATMTKVALAGIIWDRVLEAIGKDRRWRADNGS
ncbi:MAG: bifunctional phosphopantothenoylcysteine decarboxylase/phosphopantothenate--cysteine ligase CoaBC [Acidimicrobiia bacterium]